MHPPFFTVDRKIGLDIYHYGDERSVTRRNRLAPLRLTPAATGWPPVPLRAGPPEDAQAVQYPSGKAVWDVPKLQVVPLPQRRWRDIIRRFLIRAGQRMILENRA